MTEKKENIQNEDRLNDDELIEAANNPVSENESAKSGRDKVILKSVVAGTVGVAAGGAGLMAAMSFKEPDKPVQDTKFESLSESFNEPASESVLEIELESENFDASQVLVAHKVSDDMSFNEAFATARHEVGPGGVFKWHGSVYGTYYANEWQGLSDKYQHAFNNYNYNFETEQQFAEEFQFTADPFFPEEQQSFNEPQSAEVDVIIQDNFYPEDVVDYDNLAGITVVSENENDVVIINSESFETDDYNVVNASFDRNNFTLIDINLDGNYAIKVVDDNSTLDYLVREVEVNDASIEEIQELIVAPVVDDSFDYDVEENDYISDFNNNADISNFI